MIELKYEDIYSKDHLTSEITKVISRLIGFDINGDFKFKTSKYNIDYYNIIEHKDELDSYLLKTQFYPEYLDFINLKNENQ